MARTNIRGAQIADGANGVDLTVDITGVLPVANGGTGAATLTGVLVGNGTSAVTAVAAPSGAIVGTTDSQTLAAKTLTTPVLNGAPTGTGVATAATASTLALRDANGNMSAAAFLEGYTTTATAAGTTTLTVSSNYLQFLTGSTTQTVTLPVASTLVLGQQWLIVNSSTGAVTVQSSGSNSIVVVAAGTSAMLTCILTSGTGTGSWQATYFGDVVTSGKKLSVSNTLTFAGTDGTTQTFQASDTIVGRATTDTLTNKTLTSPVINTPTGIVKGDVGLGNVDNTSNSTERAATRTLTNARVNPRVVTATSTSTLTVDSDSYDIATLTAQAAALTIAAPTGTPVAGQKLMYRFKDNGTARALTWNAAFIASGVTALPSTTVISKTHHCGFIYDEVATKWVLLAVDSSGY